MPNKPPSLLPLPFGELKAVRHVNARSLADQIDKSFPGLNAYDPLAQGADFFAKTVTLKMPGVTVVASSMSASRVDREGRQFLTVMLPLMGRAEVTVGDKTIAWGAGKAGVLLPECDGRIIGSGDDRMIVMLRLEAGLLQSTANAMLGTRSRSPRVDLNLHAARAFPLALHGRPVEPLLLQIGRLLDLHDCHEDILTLQGYADWFNRMVVGLIRPELFAAPSPPDAIEKSAKVRVINQLCDEMLASLSRKITLTELEQKSGYSARALQYAFMERFGCSPFEWLREHRVQAARRRLLRGDVHSITQLAHDCGFGSASQFSLAYKGRFGETPGQTLR